VAEAQRDDEVPVLAAGVARVNDTGRVLVEGTFLDAALYPVGAREGLYLTGSRSTSRSHPDGHATRPGLATGTFDRWSPPTRSPWPTPSAARPGCWSARPSGSACSRRGGWGRTSSTPDQTEFARLRVPHPRGRGPRVRLETGEVFVGDVWLVGDDGVVLRAEDLSPVPAALRPAGRGRPGGPGGRGRRPAVPPPAVPAAVAVRDPAAGEVDPVPDANGFEFETAPDAAGNVTLTGNNFLAPATVLRVNDVPGGRRNRSRGADPAV
jgi:hypothetical protein